MNIKSTLPRLLIENVELKDTSPPTLSELVSQCVEDYLTLEHPYIDLATANESLKKKVENSLQKRLYYIGITRYMNEVFDNELIAASSTKHAKMVRKIIKMTCNITTKKLENIYSIIKTVVKLGSDKELLDLKTKECASLNTSNLALKENDLLSRPAKDKRFDDDDTSFSLKASNNDTSSSTIEVNQNKKHLIKKITYQTNSIGSMIINFNNSMDDMINESGTRGCNPPVTAQHNKIQTDIENNLSASNNDRNLNYPNTVRPKHAVADKFLFDPISLHKILGTYLSQDSNLKDLK